MRTSPAPANPRYQALLRLLRTADAVWTASRSFFGRWGIGPSQFNILNLLQANASGLSQTELSRQLIMHRSNVTGLIDRLERRGLVERKDVAGDRRAYRVVLSPAGTRLLEEILPEYHARVEGIWKGVPEKRVLETSAALQSLTKNAGGIAPNLIRRPRSPRK